MGSGTFASLLTLIIFIFIKPTLLFHILLILFLFITGLYFSSKLEKKLMVKDPAIIVIDEVTGMFISFLPLTFISQLATFSVKFLKIDSSKIYHLINYKYFYLLSSFLIFIIFRFYDIFKPLFIKKVQKFSSGFGIMIDDILAGLATIITYIVLFFISGYTGFLIK